MLAHDDTNSTSATTAEPGFATLEVSTDPLSPDEIERVATSAARKARSKFYGYVELEDMLQEARVALHQHKKKIHEWAEAGEKNKIFNYVFKQCARYAHKEKAAAVGYRMEDLFFYSIKTLRVVVPTVLEAWSGDEDAILDYPDSSLFIDVADGLRALSEADYQIIWWAFKGDPGEEAGYSNVAGHLKISADASRQRVNRILRNIQETLGGENPVPRRRARSNAASLAETRSAWEGNG